MKRILLLSLAYLALATACDVNHDLSSDESERLPAGIPKIITASIGDMTKTTYDPNGKFEWVKGDQIAVYYTRAYWIEGEPFHQSWLLYEAKNSGPTASFEYVSNDQNANRYFAFSNEKGYEFKPAGIAVYPASAAVPSSNIYEVIDQNTPFVSVNDPMIVRQGNLDDTYLTGMAQSSENEPAYVFSTACGILAVTLSNLPENAFKLALVTSDVKQYPVAGEFNLKKTDGKAYFSFGSGEGSTFKKEGTSRVEVLLNKESSASPRAIYFQVPVGTYPANTLEVEFYTGDAPDKKWKIGKDLNIQRNVVYNLPTLDLGYTN